ncbi:hypothetical protein KUCAC02_014368 [Chaenocephalus aceratus]|uniref:Uncharacterized protein n=1 Tax=Chaenocephalus aceratus TaxID=36190 RepID=A0ACB9WE72_CHAAC|nr:hypothetical protein KUCAC02_014368 [Chaenocephalus aceratus]
MSQTFQVEKEDIISSKSADYQVLDFIGEGGFSKVAKCVNLKTSEIIAIKIYKDSQDQVEEVRMQEIIRKLDPEKNNLIRCIDNFFFRDVSCLAFEMLDQSLLDFMINRQKAYRLNEIRPITQQLLVALKALKSIGVIHSDVKLDNIMFVNHQNQPFRIKLINFGLAIPTSEVEIGTENQPLPYRAPEVTLGLPISEAIDMWSLGCIIAEMYFYARLFSDGSKYCSMKVICHMIGQPGDHLLNAGKFTSDYFIRELKNSPEWRFKTLEEYKEGTGVEPDMSECVSNQYSSLDEAIEDYAEEQGRVELKDRMVFVQLLKRLLDLDANSRITPEQALTHSFVTMDHLEEDLDCSPYVADAVRWMAICRLDHSDASDVANNSETFQVEKEDIISSKSADYQVLDFIGEGGFGKVAKCVNLKTSEIIAIKIYKDSEDQVEEVRMLEIIRKLDPEKNNLIRCIDNFFFRDVSCLAFEMLDQSLLDFMINRQKAYRLNEIRPITQQLLSIGVIHSYVKHDNIMFVNHQNQPFRIKLINFGLATSTSEVEIGTENQPLPYRAPEVTLGLPISEAIDMWSLGCIIAEMYFYARLFSDGSKYCSMKVICHMIGQPGDHLLNAGKFTSDYFIRELKNSPEWRFKTLEEYKEGTGVEPDISECVSNQYSSLDEAIEDYAEEQGRVELKDRMVFVQLLKRLLDLDANSRITPEQALTHSFVTMDHLEEDLDCSPYVADAVRWMAICRLDHSDASDVANNSETFQVEKEDIISSKSADYQVLDFIGEGGFGKVAKCVNLKTSEIIAIKIHKDSEDQVEEVRMLEIIRKLDPEKNNLIRFIDNFFFRDVSCLAFEMLDQSLLDFLINREKAYRLNEIRPITQQLLVAFKALKSIGVIHSNLNHDNIMFVNHQNQPFRIKLIDFGLAIPTSEVEIGTEMQVLGHGVPEVYLGLPISEAIDMWSLGCIIAEMYFGTCLFPGSSKYCIMKVICHMIGQPGDHLLNAGKFTSDYFIRELKNSPEWRFKTLEEYKEGTGVEPDMSECVLDQYSSLDEAIEDYAEEQGRVELKDRMVFVQLLKRLLDLDANSRITPEQALTHSFVTMDHLEEDLDCSPYVADAVRWMAICRLDHSDALDVANNSETFQVEKEDIISSKSADYQVLEKEDLARLQNVST